MAHRTRLLFGLTLLLLARTPAWAQAPPGPTPPGNGSGGGVLVTPTRLVFDDRKRTGEVSLSNAGNGLGVYRISLVRMDMNEDGGCTELPLERLPGQIAIQDMIRFSPKVVTLNPQESQSVRIQVRKPADLPAGEYRLHMVFREEPPPAPEPVAAGTGEPPKGITIRLTSLFGVAIPVIIRHGETAAKATLTGLTLDADRKVLRFRLERTGNQSVHGDIKVALQPPAGKPVRLAEANGLSVFTPNAFRNLAMPLEGPVGRGRLRVTFTAPEDQGGALLAEASLEVH